MRAGALFLVILPVFAGCQTHRFLRNKTVCTTDTLADLNYQQIMDNLARFVHNPSSMPSIAIISAGTVTVGDQKSINANATYAPTLTFPQQMGAGMPIVNTLFNPSASRTVTENWSMMPVTDIDNLRRIRCAFQLVVLEGGQTSNCDECLEMLKRFYLGETDRMECELPTGWFMVGGKKDVPKDACHVGHHCGTYVWVMPDGVEGLTRFTMNILELAGGKPHAPTQTVVSTYNKDGKLESKQVTTTEIDWARLERARKAGRGMELQRQYVSPPMINPGLFFVPH
jgi:hypothetical protein